MSEKSPLDISLGVTTGIPVNLSLKLSVKADKNHYSTIWVGDDILKAEVFTYTSIIANHVKNIQIGLGVISPYVYPLSTIASASLTLSEITENNFILGLGVGGSVEVKSLTGLQPVNVISKLKNTVTALKKIFNQEPVNFEDHDEKLVGFKLSFAKYSIPIFLGVRGPKLLELAGRIADGVIFSTPLRMLNKSINIVEKSAFKAGRNPGQIRKILWNGFILLEDAGDLKLAKNVVLTIISSMSSSLLNELGLDRELTSLIRSEFFKGNKAAAMKYVTDDLIREFCIFGSIDEIKETFFKIRNMGIDEVIIGPPFGSKPFKIIQIMRPENLWRK